VETPSTRGRARPARPSALYTSTTAFWATRVTPGTASAMARASRSPRPTEALRISMRSASRVGSRSCTITLRMPRASISSSACFSAPAPMESMAITAPTPNTMPSMVRKARRRWARRLSRPLANDSRRSISAPGGSEGGGGRGRRRRRAGRLRVLEGHAVALLQALLDDHAAHAARARSHLHRHEDSALQPVHDRLALLLHEGAAGHGQHALAVVHHDGRAHAL